MPTLRWRECAGLGVLTDLAFYPIHDYNVDFTDHFKLRASEHPDVIKAFCHLAIPPSLPTILCSSNSPPLFVTDFPLYKTLCY
jgi:hypothetical protein